MCNGDIYYMQCVVLSECVMCLLAYLHTTPKLFTLVCWFIILWCVCWRVWSHAIYVDNVFLFDGQSSLCMYTAFQKMSSAHPFLVLFSSSLRQVAWAIRVFEPLGGGAILRIAPPLPCHHHWQVLNLKYLKYIINTFNFCYIYIISKKIVM